MILSHVEEYTTLLNKEKKHSENIQFSWGT